MIRKKLSKKSSQELCRGGGENNGTGGRKEETSSITHSTMGKSDIASGRGNSSGRDNNRREELASIGGGDQVMFYMNCSSAGRRGGFWKLSLMARVYRRQVLGKNKVACGGGGGVVLPAGNMIWPQFLSNVLLLSGICYKCQNCTKKIILSFFFLRTMIS